MFAMTKQRNKNIIPVPTTFAGVHNNNCFCFHLRYCVSLYFGVVPCRVSIAPEKAFFDEFDDFVVFHSYSSLSMHSEFIFRLFRIVERCCRLYSIGSIPHCNYTHRNLQTSVRQVFLFLLLLLLFLLLKQEERLWDSESAQYICFDLNSILMSQQEKHMKNNNIDRIEWRISLFGFESAILDYFSALLRVHNTDEMI